MQFPFQADAVATVVVGARSAHEVAELSAMIELQIPPELWAESSAHSRDRTT